MLTFPFEGDIKELKVLNLPNVESPLSARPLFSEAVKANVVVDIKPEMVAQFEGFPEEEKDNTWTLPLPKVWLNKVCKFIEVRQALRISYVLFSLCLLKLH